MSQGVRKNGTFELKYNEDKTQVIGNIFPPVNGGDAITTADILEKLKGMGVTYGIREQAILEAIHNVNDNDRPATGIIVAQGTVPQDGIDAKVKYVFPAEQLSQPLPKRTDGSGLIDWFALEAGRFVTKDTELASIIPPQPGVVGKTLTWPIQTINPKPGKPSALNAGANVRCLDDGSRLYAAQEGYVCLQGDQLVVYPLKVVKDNVTSLSLKLPTGLIAHGNVGQSNIRCEGNLVIKGKLADSEVRAFGDVFLQEAENCSITCTGNVYVFQGLKGCEVNTREKVKMFGKAVLVGGSICATRGIEATTLGSEEFLETEVLCGVDKLSPMRSIEIQEDLNTTEANIKIITQALKPFSSMNVQEGLSEDKKLLLSRLQLQKRTQEARVKELHNEKRFLTIAAKEKIVSEVVVSETVHPNVWIRIRGAALQIEAPMQGVRFKESFGGKSIQTESLAKAA